MAWLGIEGGVGEESGSGTVGGRSFFLFFFRKKPSGLRWKNRWEGEERGGRFPFDRRGGDETKRQRTVPLGVEIDLFLVIGEIDIFSMVAAGLRARAVWAATLWAACCHHVRLLGPFWIGVNFFTGYFFFTGCMYVPGFGTGSSGSIDPAHHCSSAPAHWSTWLQINSTLISRTMYSHRRPCPRGGTLG